MKENKIQTIYILLYTVVYYHAERRQVSGRVYYDKRLFKIHQKENVAFDLKK